MAAHKTPLIASVLLLAACLCGAQLKLGPAYHLAPTARAQTRPQRIVSIVPSVTEMLFAIGAGPRVVGVGNFDTYPPEALTRPKVGGLIDPDIERIIALKPDLVVVYGTQSDLRTQMERAHIPVFLYQHAGLADITTTIRELGSRAGNRKESAELANQIEADIAEVRKRVAGRPPASNAARVRTRCRDAARHLRERRHRLSS
jgi:iron complex transport system substrate-binding protein